MGQLSFDWPLRASYDALDFIVSDSNEQAATFLQRWPETAGNAALLSGPKASGKTHLARCWSGRVSAYSSNAANVGTLDSAALCNNSSVCLLEDIETITDEKALFHLLRHVETHPVNLLLTSQLNAKELQFTLPDLRSRLLALPCVTILPPDETLLGIFLTKWFADRQMRVSEEVISYIIKRIERSFEAAGTIAKTIERKSLESGKSITIPAIRSLF